MSRSRLLSLRLAVAVALLAAAGILAYGISQENPVGSLKGRVVARESGAPLRADVTLASPAPEYVEPLHSYRTTCAKDGSFEFRNVAAGPYKLEIQSEAHNMKPIHVAIAEGSTQTLEAQLEPDSPSLELYIHQHVFTPGETAQVTCHGFLESDTLDVRIYKVDPNAFLIRSDRSLQRLLALPDYSYDRFRMANLKLDTNPSLKLVSDTSTVITKRDTEGVFTQRVKLPVLAPGLYVTSVRSAGLQAVDWVMVTSLGLIVKTAGSRTLAYTVDLKSGAPMAATDVNIFLDNRPAASGKTNANGLVYLSLPANQTGHPDQMVVARSGDSFAFISAGFSSTPASQRMIYAYTERPVYRPGQFVYFKGIIRDNINDAYRTPKPQPVVVEVRDPDDTLIYRGTKTTDRFGCYSGAVHLNSEATTGHYSIQTSVNGESNEEQNAGFNVAAYRKPEFSVKATFDQKRYIRGDWARAKVSVNYYFGSPVANANVTYTVNRSEYWLFEDDEPMSDYSDGYSDYGGYGEQVSTGTVRTDANGEAIIEFPATWEQPKQNDGYDTDQQFTVSLTATDKGGTEATGEGSVLVTRGEFAIGVQPDCYVVKPGSSVTVTVKAKDYDQHPVRNQDVTVSLNREHWSNDGEYTLETLEEKQATTDNLGRATVQLPVKRAGSMTITARSRDSRGNEIVSTSYVWSCRDNETEECFDPTLEGIDVQLDKRTYSPGDTAQVLIMTSHPGGTALVTIEGSRIYESRTVKLATKSTVIKLAVKGDYKPNFYISVCNVRNKRFDRKEIGAKISVKSEALSVKIDPSRRKYKPGQKADYKLKVTDSRGKPVSAELSMGVVDEAIYAIEPESTTPILDYFYAHRDNRVQTYDSFPQIYLSDPDKAGSPLANQPMKIRVRKRFLDTAYWAPNVITDANGEANISFDLPDNLTTWRTTVRGITASTMCGQATNTVIAQQPMLVRLEMPRFLVQDDKSTLTAVVHNYTGKDQRVKVTLRAPQLKVDDDLERSILVRDEGSERIDWSVSAPRTGAFAVRVRAEGETAGDAVQLDLPIKPHGQETSTSTSAVLATPTSAARLPGAIPLRWASMNLHVRNDAILDATRLKVRLAPSLASTVLGSLEYLAQYPYGCTEQTVSCFLPDVVLYQTLKSLPHPTLSYQERVGVRSLEAELPDMVHKGFARLYRFQLDDGGWSWCEYGKSDPWMTAYVCYALVRAKEAGFPVKEEAMHRGLQALLAQVRSSETYLYPRAFGCYTLALAGQDVGPEIDALAARIYLNNETLAALALGYQKLGQHDKAKAMLTRFFEHAIVSGDGTHWKGGYRYDGGDIEPTALGLDAVLKIAPNDPRVYDIVRWLMKTRKDDCWWSTRGTAMSLYAMSEFLKITKELTPNETVTVRLNRKVVGTAHFDKTSIYAPQLELTVRAPDLRKGRNELMLTTSGQGNVYYSTNLTQYIAQKFMPPLVSGAGLSITRAYYSPPSDYYGDGGNPGSPITGCGTGEVVLVRLTVHASTEFRHMLVEDCIPAGCEIVDKGEVSRYDWFYWWNGQDIRDDKISFYLDYLSSGKQVLEYRMRAGFAGTYGALPARVFSMYDPSIISTTGETGFTIR